MVSVVLAILLKLFDSWLGNKDRHLSAFENGRLPPTARPHTLTASRPVIRLSAAAGWKATCIRTTGLKGGNNYGIYCVKISVEDLGILAIGCSKPEDTHSEDSQFPSYSMN
jgi:hypothetical protein